jgi:hypothetical protein
MTFSLWAGYAATAAQFDRNIYNLLLQGVTGALLAG